MLKFSVLASGSSGNSVYIETDQVKVVLDAGISGRQLQQRLDHAAGAAIDSIDALLLTHEHIDHVRGFRQVVKQSHAAVYTTQGTWQHIRKDAEDLEQQGRLRWVTSNQAFAIGDLQVTPFTVSHDAEEPVAYRFDCGDNSLTVLTDLGYVSDHIKGVIAGSQCFVLETNHDVEMLRAGKYPWSLKRRILGDKGHLSNQDAAAALGDVLGTDPVDVYMAHLSDENNQPDLAQLTVETVLKEMKESYIEQVCIRRTSRTEATPLHKL